MKNRLFFFIAAAISLLYCCDAKKQTSTQTAMPATGGDVLVLHDQPLSNLVEANGTVVADQYVQLRPEISGRIITLNVPEGKMVQAGTVIATIYNADLKAQLEKDSALLDIAKKTESRLKQLVDINGVNEQDYDNAVAQVNSTQADIDYVKAQLNKTIIVAPFTGIVGLRNVSLGAFVTSNDVITTIQQLSNLKVDFTLPDTYAGAIKKDDPVKFSLSQSDFQYSGRVLAVEPQVNADTRNLKVRAVFDTIIHGVNPGAFAKVYVQVGNNQHALLVPSYAIIPESDNNKLVLIKDGKAVFAPVKTGVRTNGWVQITEGCSNGDTVLITGTLFARAGAPIKVSSVKTPEEIGAIKE